MPSVSEKQHNAMEAAAHGHSTLSIPESVGKEFVAADSDEAPATELDIARSMAAGELSSPQKVGNSWLFDLRVTGTGAAYRRGIDELTYRDPAIFLTEEFVARCNGLPVVFEHPKDSLITPENYQDQLIGSIVYPFIKNDEVRGIARILDADAALVMQDSHRSTSPAVVFKEAQHTEEVDGQTVLIEGMPTYLDHLAICQEGVWDKSGTPTGVKLDSQPKEEKIMEEEKLAEILAAIHGIAERVEKLEKPAEVKLEEASQAPTAELAVDSAPKGNLEEKSRLESERLKEEESKKLRADNAEMKGRLDALDAKFADSQKEPDMEERETIADSQAKADSVMQMFGEKAKLPMHGESSIAYRKRLAAGLIKHSPAMKDIRLDSMDAATFGVVEARIYADAQAASISIANSIEGRLIPHVSIDNAGRRITTYQGDMNAWLGSFKSPRRIVRINKGA